MPKAQDLTGQVFGRLTVVSLGTPYVSPKGTKYRRWLCKCECGNTTEVRPYALKQGSTTSCGCVHKEVSAKNATTHGLGTSGYLYRAWCEMKQRCYNPNKSNCEHYKTKGIIVSPLWINDYQAFHNYVEANLGERPEGYSLDRINNNGNYEPGNIRWASKATQRQNQSDHKKLPKNNSSGTKGVYYRASKDRYEVYFNHSKTDKEYLGSSKSYEEAVAIRKEAEDKYYSN